MTWEILELHEYETDAGEHGWIIKHLLPMLPPYRGMKEEDNIWTYDKTWKFDNLCDARKKGIELLHNEYPNACLNDLTYDKYEVCKVEVQGDMQTYYCKDEDGNKFTVFIDHDETITIGPYCPKSNI
jgi:hypothetical protein